jgi:hypothetical protein
LPVTTPCVLLHAVSSGKVPADSTVAILTATEIMT